MSIRTKHQEYTHQHGFACGHVAIIHAGHTDYLHDGHLEHADLDHVDEHVLEVNATNHPHGNHCLDCVANGSLPVPDRLDSVARFALPLRAPAPESLLGMHLSHPRAGPGHHNRPTGEDPSARRFRAALTSRSWRTPHFGQVHRR
jgi:hypothetical protein